MALAESWTSTTVTRGPLAPREALLERRHRLALVPAAEHPELVVLLQEVDAALDRLDQGRYGRCEGCGDPIEPLVLAAEPAARTCLDCMSAAERGRLGRDLELAGEFQAALLPPPDLRVAGWELALHYQPLGALSGDTCDLVVPDDGGDSFHFLLGDVAGKGVSASLLMAHLHALYRSMIELGLPLAETVSRVNRLFCQSTTTGAYATAVAGRVERSGRVELCNAGHPQPVLLGATTDAAGAPRSLPLGLFPGSEYRSFEVALGEGEGLLLYTDGLSEAENAAGDEYGHARICAALSAVAVASARDTVAAMLADLTRWSGTAALSDDLTVLALRRLQA